MKAPLGLALAALAAGACSELNTPIYFDGPAPLELQGDEKPPRVTNGVALRFRAPNQQERMDLRTQGDALKAQDPMGRDIQVPWVSRDKVHVEVLFTVKNLDSDMGQFDVVLDGATEFTKYDETIVSAALAQGNNDQPVYFPLLPLHPHLPGLLGPGQTYQGVLREDDLAEAESDIDAMGRWSAPFASVLVNRSDVSPIGLDMVPPHVVTPALYEIDITFTADKHMTCEWSVRVRDDDDRLWHVTGDPHFDPKPTLFQPTLPMP